MKNLTIPSYIQTINEHAFQYCDHITQIDLPKGISIEKEAFQFCSKLEIINFNESGVGGLGEGVFRSCTKLTTIEFPKGMYTIPNYFVCNCAALKNLKFQKGHTYIGIGSYTFCNCTSLKSFQVFPEQIKTIGDNAFEGCTGNTGTLTLNLWKLCI